MDTKGNGETNQKESGGAKAKTAETRVVSNTPENKQGAVDPSAPGETGTTPGSNGK